MHLANGDAFSLGLIFWLRNRGCGVVSQNLFAVGPENLFADGGVIVEGDTEKMMTLFCKTASFWA